MPKKKAAWALPKGWVHGDVFDVPTALIEANDWNPNEMTAEEFDMLSDNVVDVGFLDPILIVPKDEKKGAAGKAYGGEFRVIDGEHRFEVERLNDATSVKSVICDPERIDEAEQMRQTSRMNQIKGKMSPTKFARFVDRFAEKSETPMEDLPYVLGFVDEDEFEELKDQARSQLPTDEMKDEFDKAKDEIKTVQDLTALLNRLFTHYGDTLPAHFMILDFGGKDHVWVRMEKEAFKFVRTKVHEIYAKGFTVDSVIERMMLLLDVETFCDEHADFLLEAEEPKQTDLDIDELLGDD